MSLENTLKSIGLNYREIKVYLATLELGESTVTPISKKSGFMRTYCYDILEELKKKRLVDYIEKNGRRQYFAEDPKKIEETLKDNLKDFQTLLPDLRSIYNRPGEKPRIRYFEGKEGIISIYQENTKAKEMLAIGSPKHIYEHIPEYFHEHAKQNKKDKMIIREIVTADSVDAPYLKEIRPEYQQVRVLPKELKFPTDMMIFENKLALISYGVNLHGVIIESSSIVETQKIIFEFVWQASKPLN